MLYLLQSPFSTERYKSVADKQRARLIYLLMLAVMLFFTVVVVIIGSGAIQFNDMVGMGTALNSLVRFGLLLVYGSAALTILLTRLGYRRASAYAALFSFVAVTTTLSIPSGMIYSPTGGAAFAVILVGGFLLGAQGIAIGVLASTLTVILALWQRQFIPGAPDNAVFTLTLSIILFLATGLLHWFFLRLQRAAETEQVAKASRGREELATLTTQLAQRISRHFVLSDLLDSTVEDIRQTYPHIYHVQIFLNDDQANESRLAASTGEVGKALLRRKHSLPIGSRSVIGQVATTGTRVVSVVGGSDSVHRRNEFLPDTAAEAAFPLRLGGGVIGALDLQSKQSDAFDDPDGLTIFQSLADSIAIAVDNARLFEQTEQRIVENQRLLDQMRGAMREVERLNSRLTERAWSNFLAFKGDALGVTVDLNSNLVRQSAEATPTLETAQREGRALHTTQRDHTVISAPLRVRGQVIGAMEFEIDALAVSDQDMALVNGVAERFGLALESARLYEESRRVAQREFTLNQIGARLQTSNTVDALLAETARGLQASLGAQRVAIRLGAPGKTNGVEER